MIFSAYPLFSLSIVFSVCLTVTACQNKIKREREEEINLEQEVTNRQIPRDSIFFQFEKNWKKFISPLPELTRPVFVEQQEVPTWQPLVITDCVYSQEAGGAVPQVELTWQEPVAQNTVRFDIALQSQGFERNYYSSVFPVERLKRFSLPLRSELVRDTAALLLTGPAMFPKIVQFSRTAIRVAGTDTLGQPQVRNAKGANAAAREEVKLRIVELGAGLSYKIRKCTFNKESWNATQEVIFNTPICPTDRQ